MNLFSKKVYLKALLAMISLASMQTAQAQNNRDEHDNVPYYFGLSIGTVSSSLNVIRPQDFLSNPNFRRVEPVGKKGIELGLSATARLSNHFEVRFNPKLIVGGSMELDYYHRNSDTMEVVQLPQTIFSLPFALKFNSDRIGNMKAYVFLGPKLDINLSANAEEYKKQMAIDNNQPPAFRNSYIGYEAGMGISFYMPFAVISPEIRVSNSFQNNHLRDITNPYSDVIDRMSSRMVAFSVHISH